MSDIKRLTRSSTDKKLAGVCFLYCILEGL